MKRAIILKQILVLIFSKGDKIEVRNGVDIELTDDEWIDRRLGSFVEVRHHVLNVEDELL